MSRRYGRNQRRRAREAIAQQQDQIQNLERARDLDAGLRARQRETIDDLREEIEIAKSMLPLGSVCLSPKPLSNPGARFGDPVKVRVDTLYSHADYIDEAREAYVAQERLHVLVADADVDLLNRRLHAYLTFDKPYERRAYAFSTDVLLRSGPRELEQLVRRHVTPLLVRAVLEAARAAMGRR